MVWTAFQNSESKNSKRIRIEDVPTIKHKTFTHPEDKYDCSSFCLNPIDQGSCGSCWAIATVQCVNDRIKIKNNVDVKLSIDHVSKCTEKCVTFQGRVGCSENCEGGFLTTAFEFIKTKGVFEEKNYRKACSIETDDDDDSKRWKIQGYYFVQLDKNLYGITNARRIPYSLPTNEEHDKSVKNICEEIYLNGPVAACMNLFSDWIDFAEKNRNNTNQVYRLGWKQKNTESINQLGNTQWTKLNPGPGGIYFVTGHAVCIMGWGVTPDGKKYWIIRNSWGPQRGMVKMEKGINCCGIESDVEAPFIEKTLHKSAYHTSTDKECDRNNTDSTVILISVFSVFLLIVLFACRANYQ